MGHDVTNLHKTKPVYIRRNRFVFEPPPSRMTQPEWNSWGTDPRSQITGEQAHIT